MTDAIDIVSQQLKAKQAALDSLLKSIDASLSTLTKHLGSQNTEALSAIESALADLASALEGGGAAAAIEAVAEAIKGLNLSVHVPEQPAPVVNVQVNPTPVTVEAVMPASPPPVVHNDIKFPDQAGASWEVRIPGAYGGSPRVMTITRKT